MELALTKDEQEQWRFGTYTIEQVMESSAKIRHSSLGVSKTVKIPADAELYIDFNFSQARATLRCHRTDFNMQLCTLFQNEIPVHEQKVAAKMKAMAVDDSNETKKRRIGVKGPVMAPPVRCSEDDDDPEQERESKVARK